jgi:hypothetical protein
MSASYQKKWREPHGLVKVLITFDNGTADITRHCMTVRTGHFIALVSTSQRQASYWVLDRIRRIP